VLRTGVYHLHADAPLEALSAAVGSVQPGSGLPDLQLGGALLYRLLEVGQTALIARSAQARSTQCHRPDQNQEMADGLFMES